MGELRQRGNVWWVRYYRNGRLFEESSQSKKKGDAERLLKQREGAVANGVAITPQVEGSGSMMPWPTSSPTTGSTASAASRTSSAG